MGSAPHLCRPAGVGETWGVLPMHLGAVGSYRPVPGERSRRPRRSGMKLYAIRRTLGRLTPEDVQAASARSLRVGGEMPDDVRWIRSYVVRETDGSLGLICIYESSTPE